MQSEASGQYFEHGDFQSQLVLPFLNVTASLLLYSSAGLCL